MSEPVPSDASTGARSDERAADHAAIDRLAEQLLPALIAKLGATGLGELEVREDGWRVRLRRPADGSSSRNRRAGGAARSQPGHAGHGHGPVPVDAHRPPRHDPGGNGASPPPPTAVGPGRNGSAPGDPFDDRPTAATSPAVGIYRAAADIRAGSRVRSGDRIGVVEMLGVPQDVVAPVDGIVGASLVEPGDAVEYGQELVVIEFAGTLGGEG